MKSALLLATTAACLGSTAAFSSCPLPNAIRTTSSASSALSMSSNDSDNSGKTLAASTLAAAYIFTGLFSPMNAAFALDNDSTANMMDFGSSNVIAARSGGRAGGRAPARAAPRAAPSAASSSSKTVINRSTTVIQAPPVVVGSPYGYGGYGYGYDPTPGLALNLGLSAVSSISNGMREARQNEMIYQERAELQASREREADMAMRIRELERMQMQQGGNNSNNGQAPVVYVQPPAVVQQAAPAQQ